MKKKKHTHGARFERAAIAIGALLIGSLPQVRAQTPPTPVETAPAAAPDETQELDKLVVTGSYIPFSADAPAIPVKVIGAPAIAATGQTSDLLEVIRKTVPQFVGNGNLGSANSNISGGSTNGGSQVKLRNEKTLVLINGRRAAFAPVSATGGFDFVDVNAIPVSAVERIEVVKDGASALYGSDAISGVVNVILKKNYSGAEAGGSYQFASDHGTWENRSAHITAGATSANGKTSVMVSTEWVKTDPMFQSERNFSADQTGKTSSFAGVVQYLGDNNVYLLADGAVPPLNADLTADALVDQGIYTLPTSSVSRLFNIAPYATLLMGNEKHSLVTNVSHRMGEKWELFGDLLYSSTKTNYQLAAQPIIGMPYFAQFADGFGGPIGYTLPEHPQNPFDDYVLVRNRFVDNPRGYFMDTDSIRGLVGIRGDITDTLSVEVAANLNRSAQDFRNTNVINRVNLANAIDAGTINLFARTQDPTNLALANIFGTAFARNISSLNSFDARVNGELPWTLPGGTIRYAVGGEWRRETLSSAPDSGSFTVLDPNSPIYGSPSLWDGATSADPFSVSRKVTSGYLEVRIPVTQPSQGIRGLNTLEIDAAVRHDAYSDSDDPTVPKFSLRWLPFNDEFAVRASYSESFSAASLYSLFGPTGVGFTDQPVGLEFVDGTVLDDTVDQAFLRILPNANLKPDKAKSYNAGVVYSPRAVKGLSLEATYFRITHTDIPGSENETEILQDVETNGADSEFADRVRFGSFNGTAPTAPGQVSQAYRDAGGTFTRVFVTNFEENFVESVQDGVDVAADYNFEYAPVGHINLRLDTVWFNSFSVEDEEYVGTTNGNSALNGGTIPRWISYFTAEVARGNWGAGFNVQYIPKVTDPTAAEDEVDPIADQKVESYTSVDLFLNYDFSRGRRGWASSLDGLSVRVGVNNVFNEQPPMAASSWTDSGTDIGTYSALGRVFHVTANYKF